jgi:hypothetical protein
MKKLALCAVALLLATAALASNDKKGISISFDSEDSRTHLGPRLNARDARLAITNRDGSVSLLLMNDIVAVQLTDRVLAKVSAKDDAGFLEDLIVSGVQIALRKAVEYPIANISSAGIRDGALVLTNDKGQPVFKEVKVNGTDVLRDFAIGDAARFVNAFRAAKSAQR